MNLTKNFTSEELACKHCGKMAIPLPAVDKLQRLRDHYGRPLKLSSAYRCPEHNAAVSSTGRAGPHTKAAFDVLVSGPEAYQIVALALLEGFTGIGVSQKGPHAARFIHLDALDDAPDCPRPYVWSY